MEVWKPIQNYNGIYEVSSIGNVRRLNSNVECKTRWGGIRTMNIKGCRLKKFKGTTGYNIVILSKNGITKTCMIHRLVAESFIDNPLNKSQVNHKDGNKQNNNVNNLEWSTPKENSIHSIYVLNNKKFGQKKVIDNNTGKIYNSIMDASIDLNINYSTIQAKLANRIHNNLNIALC